MALTAAQLTTWKSDISTNSNTVLVGGVSTAINTLNINNTDHADAIAKWYNGLLSPDAYAWRSSVTEAEFVGATGVDVANGNAATVWSWVGAGFITRSQGERDSWDRIFKLGSCNPSLTNVRTAFTDILSGATSPAPANRNHLTVIAKRKMTRIESLLGTGTGTFASPKVMGFEGNVSYNDLAGT